MTFTFALSSTHVVKSINSYNDLSHDDLHSDEHIMQPAVPLSPTPIPHISMQEFLVHIVLTCALSFPLKKTVTVFFSVWSVESVGVHMTSYPYPNDVPAFIKGGYTRVQT